jgi:hypothetical protein
MKLGMDAAASTAQRSRSNIVSNSTSLQRMGQDACGFSETSLVLSTSKSEELTKQGEEECEKKGE